MLIIEEYGYGNVYMGSKSFVRTPGGFAQAMAHIEAILARGNRPGGNAGEVMSYFGR